MVAGDLVFGAVLDGDGRAERVVGVNGLRVGLVLMRRSSPGRVAGGVVASVTR